MKTTCHIFFLYGIRVLFYFYFFEPISHFSLLPHHIMDEHVQIAIPYTREPNKPFTFIHISNQNTIKLTSTNYLSWKLQIKALLIGYDLQKLLMDLIHAHQPLSPQIILLYPIRNTTLGCR